MKCSTPCSVLQDLDQHLIKSHGFEPNLCHCKLCEKRFCGKITLKIHAIENHELDFQKPCEFVSQLFEIVKEAPRSMITTKQFPCSMCDKNFSYQRSLNDHFRYRALKNPEIIKASQSLLNALKVSPMQCILKHL